MADFGTSEYWLEELGKRLDGRLPAIKRARDYYAGLQQLQLVSDKFRKAFGTTYQRFADNFLVLIVQAVEERCTVQGFLWDNDAGAKKAWAIWQANQLDAQSQKAHREAFITGYGPIIVEPVQPGKKYPKVRVQKPEEVIVAYGDDPLERAVAMKRWKAPDGQLFATLYYPDRVEKYEQARTLRYANQFGRDYVYGGWVPRRVDGEAWPLPHSFGEVPVIELVNDPDLDNTGTSEINAQIPLQDALNKLLVDMLLTSETSSFRQRWATGVEVPVDPETNKPVETWKAAIDRVWRSPSKDAKFGDFAETDLSNYVKAIETVIQHMATTSRTPAHYLLGQSGTFPSGESLKATETGLVAKVKRDHRDFGEVWEAGIRLGFRAIGDDKRADYDGGQTVWVDPEYRSEAEHIDALVKLSSIGIPNEQLWSDAGYTPQEIEKFKSMAATPPLKETVAVADQGPTVAETSDTGAPADAAIPVPPAAPAVAAGVQA